jgi:hypothetical protein
MQPSRSFLCAVTLVPYRYAGQLDATKYIVPSWLRPMPSRTTWLRIHRTLWITPAVTAGLTDKLMGFENIVTMTDAVAAKPERPKIYRKK